MSEGYQVHVRRLNATTDGEALTEISKLPVTDVTFRVSLDDEDIPKRSTIEGQVEAAEYEAAKWAAGAVAYSGWQLPGNYLITVEGRYPGPQYEADIDEHGAFSLRRHKPDVW